MNSTNIPSFKISPFVSIIIPSYNRENTVSETIISILQQTCNFDFEIIIGDDCSTDNTREVLLNYQKQYPQIIRLIFHKNNIGLGANWATCVKHCKGKYIANCDNDDYWHNTDKLQLQVDFLEKNIKYGVVHTHYRTHNRSTNQIKDCEAFINTNGRTTQQAFFTGKYRICNASVMYRKDLIVKYLNLDDFIKYQFTLQDWNTWIILAKYTDFYCLPISSATFGIETDSITRPKTYAQINSRFEKEKECYIYLCNLFPADLHYDENGFDTYVTGVLLNHAYKLFDYNSAKTFAGNLRNNSNFNLKIKCALNPLTFYAFALTKRINFLK